MIKATPALLSKFGITAKPPLTDEELIKAKRDSVLKRYHSNDVSIPKATCHVQIGQTWERNACGGRRGAAGDLLSIISVVDHGGDQHAVAFSSATRSRRRIALARFGAKTSEGLRLVPNVVDVKRK